MENTKGDPIELGNIFEMSVFQQEVVTALKSFGYKYVFNKYYQLEGEKLINVGDIKNLRDLIKTMHQSGADAKISEIKNVLEINS